MKASYILAELAEEDQESWVEYDSLLFGTCGGSISSTLSSHGLPSTDIDILEKAWQMAIKREGTEMSIWY